MGNFLQIKFFISGPARFCFFHCRTWFSHKYRNIHTYVLWRSEFCFFLKIFKGQDQNSCKMILKRCKNISSQLNFLNLQNSLKSLKNLKKSNKKFFLNIFSKNGIIMQIWTQNYHWRWISAISFFKDFLKITLFEFFHGF